MKYLVSVIDDNAGLASPTEAAIDAFDDRLPGRGPMGPSPRPRVAQHGQ